MEFAEDKKTILLVDDNAALQELIKEIFETEGYDVYGALNGREALDFLSSDKVRVDLILLDLKMPVMDGYQFRAQQLSDQKIASIPVLVLSADDGSSKSAVEQLKAKGFCSKVSRVEDMLETVRRCCA
ncbi:MAG: response regulator [Candidatus Omnitrophica bacterium]|nr:response regulator [Candidatus Omnitrophota bacterium]MDE2223467.1 response regulator [Candidatus Omnitrophota bacterium]